jgi:hypothetical protein
LQTDCKRAEEEGVQPIEERQRQQFEFMRLLYQSTGGSEMNTVNMDEIGSRAGLTHQETVDVVNYAKGEGLIERVYLGGGIGISHYGIKEVEEALSRPDDPTEHFPPVNMIHVEHMYGSQIQQGTYQSQQHLAFSSHQEQIIRALIEEYGDRLDELGLPDQDRAEAESDIATVRAQLSSPRGKPQVIWECLGSLRRILEGAAGGLAGAGAQALLRHFGF